MKGWRRKLYLLFWFRLPMKRARVITAISEETRQRLIRDFPLCADKIVVVPDCISQSFQPLAKPPPGERPVVLQVGTKSNKNVIRLAEALRDIKCRLEIVGRLSAEQEQALQRNQVEYGCCWDVSENELIQKYGRADLLAFVSTAEGFGLPILEAQTIGRPVVTSNVSSMPEVAGEGACFVDPFSVESIRSGIKHVLADSAYRDCLVRAGTKNVKRFSPAEIARRYVAVYEGLTRKSGAQTQKSRA
jgi:glycosyltransferase involved in cell wall biosynthesis